MAQNLKGRSLLRISDINISELQLIIETAINLKKNDYSGYQNDLQKHKIIAGLFEKNSTRTRTATDFAAHVLGASVSYIDSSGSNMGSKESVEDTAKVLGRMYDGILYRCMRHSDCEQFAKYSGIPIINGLSEKFHPTQMLGDIMTICEHTGKNIYQLRGDKFIYMGNPNNVSNSYVEITAMLGMDCTIIAPMELHERWEEFYDEMRDVFTKNGATLTITDDIEAVKGGNYIATDAWVDLGEKTEVLDARVELLKSYQITMDIIKKMGTKHPYFIHCLPAMHDDKTIVGKYVYDKFGQMGVEVSDEVFRSSHSIVFDEAENRKWTIAALFALVL